ncbi:MAG: DUF308 domain-containing protein [Christensenellaceae bacterium]
MATLKSLMQKVKINGILLAIGMIAVGVILLAVPDSAIKIVCILLGVLLSACAVIEIIGFFTAGVMNDFSFAKAVGYAVIAIWLFTCPTSIIGGIVNIIFAIGVIVSGAEQIQTCVQLAMAKYVRWWILLILGLITVALGVIAFFVQDAAFTYLGIILLVDGIIAAVKIAVFDRRLHKAKKTVKEIKAEVIDETKSPKE